MELKVAPSAERGADTVLDQQILIILDNLQAGFLPASL